MRIRIITMPRTKATYLMKAIVAANNPEQWKVNADFFNEPYNDRTSPESALEWMRNDDNAVIKHHIRHLVADDVYDSDRHFTIENDLGWYNVVVLRRNLFDAAISYARSRTLDEWHGYTDTQVNIDPELFVNCVLALWGSLVHIVRNKHKLHYDKIIFSDDLTGDPNTDIKLILPDFSGDITVDSVPSPQNTILNIDQLKQIASTIELPQHDGVVININCDLNIIDFV